MHTNLNNIRLISIRIYDIDDGYRFGVLSLKMNERFKSKTWLGRVTMVFYSSPFCYKNHFSEATGPLLSAYRVGLACGDIENAMMCANMHCLCQLDTTPIPELVKLIRQFRDAMKFYGQELNSSLMQPAMLILLSLSGQNDGDFAVLRGEVFHGEDFDRISNKDDAVYRWSCYARMTVCYLLGDYEQAALHSRGCKTLAERPFGAGDVSVATFFYSLTVLEKARNRRRQRGLFRQVQKGVGRLQFWATHAPKNFLGKMYLLQAELARAKGDRASAYPKYESAIAMAREGGFFVLTALAFERTGKFFLEDGKRDVARPYLEEALNVYGKWGGYAKRDHLKAEIEKSRALETSVT